LNQQHEDATLYNRVLFETSNFIVFPTIGALVEGWVMLIPKRHHLCVGALSDSLLAELEALRDFVSMIIDQHYGPVAIFEHGPASPRKQVGCGVDHAHLHVVPTHADLISIVQGMSFEPLKFQAVEDLQTTSVFYRNGLPYLYIEQPVGEAYMATHPSLQSQLFRRAIASSLGSPDRYD